jgi:5-methylcytosine-specific restriction enzyme A
MPLRLPYSLSETLVARWAWRGIPKSLQRLCGPIIRSALLSECSKHPQWQPTGLEWRCPFCAASSSTGTKRRPRNGRRAVQAGQSEGKRLSDLSGGAWQTIRERIRLRDKYTCQCCGIAVRTGEVDHIIPVEQGGTDADENLQLLCHDCHVDKTNRDNGHRVKTAYGPDGFPLDPGHHWNR